MSTPYLDAERESLGYLLVTSAGSSQRLVPIGAAVVSVLTFPCVENAVSGGAIPLKLRAPAPPSRC